MRTSKDRLPISELLGPGVAHMLTRSKGAFFKVVQAESGRIFSNELDHFTRELGIKNV